MPHHVVMPPALPRLLHRTAPPGLALLLAATLAVAWPTAGTPQAQAAAPTSPGPDIVITGSGWGHSVGMSQYGARAMGLAGRPASSILTHYYPGTAVGRSGPSDDALVAIDLFQNRTIGQSPDRLLLQARGRDGSRPPSTAVGVRVGQEGSHRDVELRSDRAFNLALDGSDYVLRDADGAELARSTVPMRTYTNPAAGDNPALLALPQLGASPTSIAGTFAYGSISYEGGRPVLRQRMSEYLRGISEVPSSWPAATLQAQAITARTYAARQGGAVFSATPLHQAYAGWAKEGEPGFGQRWAAAVDATRDLTVTFQGELAQTFYSSSHGLGRSEASQDSWAYGAAFPYLTSVDDPWSNDPAAGNPYASWTARAGNEAFAGVVGLARVSNVRVLGRTGGGSPKALSISGWTASGERVTCTWSGGQGCPANDAGAKGAGAALRTTLPLVDGGAGNGRIRSQQISSITIAPFTDDEDSFHQYNIGAIAATGVAKGCTTTTFCPRDDVTRGEMATFLGRAIGATPDDGAPAYSDVDGHPHEGFINALARDGKISGFPDGSYRPDAPVTRAQMASFLRRAFDVLAAPPGDRFTDIAGTAPHRDNINAVAASAVADGCGDGRYCPDGLVTREQMATFLARALRVGS